MLGSMPPTIPGDLVRAIVDALAEDFHDIEARPSATQEAFHALCQCYLTSRDFAVAARRHVFRRVYLHSVERSVSFLAVLQGRPTLSHSIHTLLIMDNTRLEDEIDDAFTLHRKGADAHTEGAQRAWYHQLSARFSKSFLKIISPGARPTSLSPWLASCDGKRLLALMCDVKDVRLWSILPGAYNRLIAPRSDTNLTFMICIGLDDIALTGYKFVQDKYGWYRKAYT
jgi:hypothetical protein